MKLIIDNESGRVLGTLDGEMETLPGTGYVDAPSDFDISHAAEYQFDAGTQTVTHDPVAALNRAKAARKARIKTEAAQLIAALDWKLTRAKEQEAAGWVTLADVDAVLAQRETIRRSSGVAETALDALTDVASVQAFTWSVSTIVAAPRRLTQTQFAIRFTDTELQGILAAAQSNPALGAWWEKFKLASDINLDDAATQAGVLALEMAGLISAGRAGNILNSTPAQ